MLEEGDYWQTRVQTSDSLHGKQTMGEGRAGGTEHERDYGTEKKWTNQGKKGKTNCKNVFLAFRGQGQPTKAGGV